MLLDFHTGQYAECQDKGEWLSELGRKSRNASLVHITAYYLARSYWKLDRLEEGIARAESAVGLARRGSRHRAISGMVQGWLQFLRGHVAEANAILVESEKALETTDDHVNKGNILSFRGRIARSQARWPEAIDYFKRAVAAYRSGEPRHANEARALVNLAATHRYSLADAINRDARKARAEAEEALEAAEEIYRSDPQRYSERLSRALAIRAWIHFQYSEFEPARDLVAELRELLEATKAQSATNNANNYLRIKSRLLDIEAALLSADKMHLQASQTAEEAVTAAKAIPHRRLEIRTRLRLVDTFLDTDPARLTDARRVLAEIRKQLTQADRDLMIALGKREMLAKQDVFSMSFDEVFNRPLTETVRNVERQVVQAVLAHFDQKHLPTKQSLGIGEERFRRILESTTDRKRSHPKRRRSGRKRTKPTRTPN